MKGLLFNMFGRYYSTVAINFRQFTTYCYSILHPYHYDAGRYQGTFLAESEKLENNVSGTKVDRIIYVFWTGDNDITPNRIRGIKSLEEISGVKVQLVTPENLSEYIVSNDPLPEAYNYLSYVHRADYLRTYFMYHHGGGYADIKQTSASWVDAFERFEHSDAYALGYPEIGFMGVANGGIENQTLKIDLRNHWRYLIGNCAYICRPKTPFTSEWYKETKRRVISFTPSLKLHPATDPFGKENGYPVPWEKILGEVFHPLCLKYHDRLLKDKALTPIFENYR